MYTGGMYGRMAAAAMCGLAIAGVANASDAESGNAGPVELENTCETGNMQSPVDLGHPTVHKLGNLELDYAEVSRRWIIEDNGHTLQVSPNTNTTPTGMFSIEGAGLPGRYRLSNIHFHWGEGPRSGTEHRVNNRQFAMEAHLVHVKATFNSVVEALASNDPSAMAVLGIVFTRGSKPNPFVEAVLNVTAQQRMEGEEFSVSVHKQLPVNTLLPEGRGLYRYAGSLTTPPCSEVVAWTVARTPLSVTKAQLDALRALSDGKGMTIEENVRPVQPLNKRKVYLDKTARLVVE